MFENEETEDDSCVIDEDLAKNWIVCKDKNQDSHFQGNPYI